MKADSKTQSTILSYIDTNPIATLGTVNSDGSPHGAIVYVCTDAHKPVAYFITKTGTAKYKNLLDDDRVSLTITQPEENSTLQAGGVAKVVEDALTIDQVMRKLTKLHASARDWLPPVAKIRAGAYVLVEITLQWARLAQYQDKSIGDKRIFTQL